MSQPLKSSRIQYAKSRYFFRRLPILTSSDLQLQISDQAEPQFDIRVAKAILVCPVLIYRMKLI